MKEAVVPGSGEVEGKLVLMFVRFSRGSILKMGGDGRYTTKMANLMCVSYQDEKTKHKESHFELDVMYSL